MKRYKQIEVFHMPIFSSLLVKQQSYNSWYSWSLWCLFVVYIYGALYLFQSLISYFVYEIKITISGCYSTTAIINHICLWSDCYTDIFITYNTWFEILDWYTFIFCYILDQNMVWKITWCTHSYMYQRVAR